MSDSYPVKQELMQKSQLKIAILSVHSSPLGQPGTGDTGGMSIYIRELTQEVEKQGHMVDIYTRVQDLATPEIIKLAPHSRLIHIQAGEPADIDKLLIYSYVPDFACKVENFRKQHNLQYDLIFSHYWLSGIAGQYLQSWWHIPQIVMFHTLGAIKSAIGIGEYESELRLQAEGQLARECHRIIATTEKEKYSLHQYYEVPLEKISVIPCGVNLQLFQPMDKLKARQKLGFGDSKIILFVGRIERLKGIDKLIRAMPYLKDIKPELVIVGEDGNRQGEMDSLKNLAKKLGIADSVNFRGLVNYEELPDFYNAADVCVLPSYYESFGLVPLESLACGTPVVATNVGDLQNIIRQGENGYVLMDNQPMHLVDKIKAVLSAKGQNMAMALSIRNSITRFGWQGIANSIIKEFNEVIVRNTVSYPPLKSGV